VAWTLPSFVGSEKTYFSVGTYFSLFEDKVECMRLLALRSAGSRRSGNPAAIAAGKRWNAAGIGGLGRRDDGLVVIPRLVETGGAPR
jgi:hypothetical protein